MRKLSLHFGLAALLIAAVIGVACRGSVAASEKVTNLPAPTVNAPLASKPGTETAVFAGGCFWGVQGVFQHVKGVVTRDLRLLRRLQEYRRI